MADPPRSPRSKWQGEESDPLLRRPKPRRGPKIFVLTLLLLGMLGTVLAIVLYPRSMEPPRFLTMTVREYAPPLPPNAWAAQDGERLAAHFPSDRREQFFDKQSREQFAKFLKRIESLPPGPVVVHLGALGRVHNGEVVLFAEDSDPDRPEQGIKLADVLGPMKGTGDGKRLLILDLGRPVADVRLGVLEDDLPAAVEREIAQVERPYFILAACSPGQTSHVSEELGASVLAYHVDLALRGFADPEGGDHRVTVSEMADFVKPRVDRWVWHNRGRRQQPKLYGQGRDFPLVQLGGGVLEMPAPAAERVYPAWLKAGWKERDEAFRSGAYRKAPAEFREMEIHLARAEKRWRAGVDNPVGESAGPSRIEPVLRQNLSRLKEAIRKANETSPPVVFSVAQLRASPDADTMRKFDTYLDRVLQSPAKGDDAKARAEEAKKLKAELLEELKKSPDAAATALVAAAVRPADLTPARIVELVDIAQDVGPRDRRLSEILYLERLKDRAAQVDAGEWQGTVVHQAVRVTAILEEILARLETNPAGFDPWNRAALVQADALRRSGDTGILTGFDFSWRRPRADFTRADLALRPIPQRLDVLDEIERARDEAFALLPGWAPYLIAARRVSPQEEAAWTESIAAAAAVADLLERKNLDSLDGLPTPVVQWQANADAWRKLFAARLERLHRLGDRDGKAAEYREWQAVLESPGLSADDRESAWKASRRLGLKLIETTPGPRMSDADAASQGVVPGADPTAAEEADRRGRRVRLTRDLFALADVPATAPADAEPSASERPVAQVLHETFVVDIPRRFLELHQVAAKSAADSSPLERADRLSRVFPEETIRKRYPGTSIGPEFPLGTLRRRRGEALWSFLRDRARDEAAAVNEQKTPRFAIYYLNAAHEYGRKLP